MTESSFLLLFLLSLSAMAFFVCRSLFGSDLDEILPEITKEASAGCEKPKKKPSRKKSKTVAKKSKKKAGRRRKS